MRMFIRRFAAGAQGATAVEYSLIAALIAVAIVGGVTLLGGNNSGQWSSIASNYPH